VSQASSFRTLSDLPNTAKIALVRVDLNVPMHDGVVSDTTRLDRLVPTLRALQEKNLKIVLLSHFGRPKGRPQNGSEADSLKPVAATLGKIMGQEIAFADDCVGAVAKDAIAALPVGKILVLENLRFHAEEEANDPAFVQQLASLGDVYINDAFSASHRAHASIEGLAHALPSFAGLLMQDELSALSAALENPTRPVIAIVGGSKISSKLDVLENLVKRVDYLFLGGGMANTFLMARGIEVGKSLCEPDRVEDAKRIMKTAEAAGCHFLLPVDRVAVRSFGANVPFEIVAVDAVAADQETVDIGPASVQLLADTLAKCKTVLWNGPMGVFEVVPFNKGTNEAASLVAKFTKAGTLKSVAGGGDTVSALEQAGVADDFSYISTAGGAFLEWLEGKPLPGVQALYNAAKKAA
jgi:phosphoglycerate kinase